MSTKINSQEITFDVLIYKNWELRRIFETPSPKRFKH